MYKVSSIVCIGIKKEKKNKPKQPKTKAACWVSDMFAALAKRQLSGSERETLKDTSPTQPGVFYNIARGLGPSSPSRKPAGFDLEPAMSEAGIAAQPDSSSLCDS